MPIYTSDMNDYVDRKLRARERARQKGLMYRQYIKSSGDGLEIALAPALGAILGYFAQMKYDISPWGVLIGLALGFGLSIRTTYRLIQQQKMNEAPILNKAKPLMHGNTRGQAPMQERFNKGS